ncbi:MAG: extracellular solute-binding protein [Actinomycetia bacterium]|nr:extracellular solute-binding protein [Actinomycetes bacterium]
MTVTRKTFLTGLGAGALLAAGGCQSGSLGSSGGGSGNRVPLKLLYPTGNTDTPIAEGLMKAFNESQDKYQVSIEGRPGGSEGDNIVKTRLATGEMPELFQYNSGSLMRNINPERNLVDLSGESWASSLTDPFKLAISMDGKVYGAPWGSGSGGGIMYNKKLYAELGLSVPKNWDEFLANSARVKAAGKIPVLQSYGTTWTSQLFILGDYANVAKADPQWAERYTRNQAKFSQEPALAGFQYTEELFKAGYFNADAAAATLEQVTEKLAMGEAAHYPVLSGAIDTIKKNHPDKVADVGFFGVPGKNATENILTTWVCNGLYIPKALTGEKLEGAKEFVKFVASEAGCKAQNAATRPNGPFGVRSCRPTGEVPEVVKDILAYSDQDKSVAALEFVSPIKGPNLEHIVILVGTGQKTAVEAAALYDEDLKKQAQQLGLPGW